jgi:oligosaccharide repeat unit polymerase
MKILQTIMILIVVLTVTTVSLFVSLADLWLKIFIVSSLTVVSLPLLMVLQRRQIDIFEPLWFFAILYGISYGYKAASIIFNPSEFITFPQYFPNDIDTILYAFFLSLMGLIAFYLGYFSNLMYPLMKYLPSLGDKFVTQRRLYIASITGIFVGNILVVVFASITLRDLDWRNMLYNPLVRSELMANLFGKGWAIVFMTLTPVYALGYYYCTLSDGIRLTRLPAFLLVLIMGALPIMIIGNRLLFLGLLVSLMVMYHYRVKRIGSLTVLIFMIVITWAAGALGILLAPRDYSMVSPYDIARRLSGTFEFFDHFVTALANVHDYYWGLTILEDLMITYLPREIFPWKPIIYGQMRLQEAILPGLYAGGGFSSTMAMGVLAEGYVNFGLMGIFLLPFVLGMILRLLYEKMKKDGGLYTVIFAFILGSMLLAIRGFGSYIVMILVVICMVWLFYKLHLAVPKAIKRGLLLKERL